MPSRGLLFGPDELLIVAVVLKYLKTVKASKLADLLVRCKRAVVELQVPRVSSETRLGRVSSSTSYYYGSLRGLQVEVLTIILQVRLALNLHRIIVSVDFLQTEPSANRFLQLVNSLQQLVAHCYWDLVYNLQRNLTATDLQAQHDQPHRQT